jgi:hypothetical protein
MLIKNLENGHQPFNYHYVLHKYGTFMEVPLFIKNG